MTETDFRRLDPDRIIKTIEQLRSRIRERFPKAGLGGVAEDLLTTARAARERCQVIRRADPWLTAASILLVLLGLGALVAGINALHPTLRDQWTWSDLIQVLESLLGTLFFLGAGVLFVTTLDERRKRRRCLSALHEMRALAHIVDMHQLTKDPERLGNAGANTPSSPERTMTRFELSRYLDYCAEILSLIGKVAALYVQDFPDSRSVTAVDEIETLTTSLSRKIWQKIMILGETADEAGA